MSTCPGGAGAGSSPGEGKQSAGGTPQCRWLGAGGSGVRSPLRPARSAAAPAAQQRKQLLLVTFWVSFWFFPSVFLDKAAPFQQGQLPGSR